jgi:hypothetical protein
MIRTVQEFNITTTNFIKLDNSTGTVTPININMRKYKKKKSNLRIVVSREVFNNQIRRKTQ